MAAAEDQRPKAKINENNHAHKPGSKLGPDHDDVMVVYFLLNTYTNTNQVTNQEYGGWCKVINFFDPIIGTRICESASVLCNRKVMNIIQNRTNALNALEDTIQNIFIMNGINWLACSSKNSLCIEPLVIKKKQTLYSCFSKA